MKKNERKMRMRKATHILWDTDDIDDIDESISQEDILASLPKEMDIPDYINEEDIPDYMSDEEFVLEEGE